VRRLSDNAEQDIGFSGDPPTLDETALLNFVGSGSGRVTTWYEQSGSGSDLTQNTEARQPTIVDSGSILRIKTFPAHSDGFLMAASSGISGDQDRSALAVVQYNISDSASGGSWITINRNGDTGERWTIRRDGTDHRVEIAGDGETTSQTIDQSPHLLGAYQDGASLDDVTLTKDQDEVAVTTDVTINTVDNNLAVGSQVDQRASDLRMSELVLYPNVTNRVSIRDSINDFYSLY